MPRSLADGHVKIAVMSTIPADPRKPTLTELEAGIDGCRRIAKSGFKLGPTDSEKVEDADLCSTSKSEVLAQGNAEFAMSIFRYFDEQGKAETGTGGQIADQLFQALKTKGTTVWLAKRFTSKLATEAWAVGDEVEVFEVVVDNLRDAEYSGFIKKDVPGSVTDFWLNGEVATGA